MELNTTNNEQQPLTPEGDGETPTTADTRATPPTTDAVRAEAERKAEQELSADFSVAGLGVDIIEIARMEAALTRTPRMKERLFSDAERAYAQKKARPIVHYALFFAAKEAVFKALGTGFAGMGFRDVEVSHDRAGRPVPVLTGQARARAEALGVVEVQLSLSYTHQVGVASAVAIREQDRPRRNERIDPRDELARQFKEMRALLDDLEGRVGEVDDAASPDTP